MSLTAGARLGPYEILTPIGAGGMGEVYRARDTRLDRIVAIKVLRPHVEVDSGRRRRFEREARVISQLNHPHICTLFDIGHEPTRLEGGEESASIDFFVMEYLQGQTLGDRLTNGALPLDETLLHAIQIADALDAAHRRGIVHRDLKPANVFLVRADGLSSPPIAKLLDFGIAKAYGVPRVEDSARDDLTGEFGVRTESDIAVAPTVRTLTAEGTLLGTIHYMSPEQLEGREADSRSDLFAFGCVLYEMLAGRRAFDGASRSAVIAAVLDREPPPIRPSQPQTPPALEQLVSSCLAKNPRDRVQSAAEVKRQLQEVVAHSNGHRESHGLVQYAIAATVALALAAGSALLWDRARAKPLTDKDVLVLADFTNTTGDAVFDGALRAALRIQLEQSPFLKIMDDAQVRQDLRFMGRSPNERVTSQVAREVCQREGERATIGGSIASLGKTYLLTLEATNCQNGRTLATEQSQADDKEHVLQAVAKAVTGIRTKLGESLASLQKTERLGLGQATTVSLEAFQAYSLGMSALIRGESLAAIPLLRKATDLDPNFAMAWEMQSTAYQGVQGQNNRVLEYEKKAFELIDPVLSPRERHFIEINYYRDVTGEWDKVREIDQLYVRTFPREGPPHYGLGLLHMFAGEFEASVRELEAHNRLGPKVAQAYFQLILAYARLDQFDKAKAAADQAVAHNLDGPLVHRALLAVAYRQRDRAAAQKEAEWFAGKPEESDNLSDQAEYAKVLGQRRKAGDLIHRAADVANRFNLPDSAARFLAPDPLGDALVGDCGTSHSRAPGTDGALALAICGDTAAAQKAADEISKRLATFTVWNAVFLPSIRAAIATTGGQPAKAIEVLWPAAAYERGQTRIVYVRGLAYLRMHEGAKAAAEFHKILDHWGANFGPFYPPSYVGLGRAEAMAGDTAKARKAYEDFFAFWKDADPDVPLLLEARKEYSALTRN